MLQTSNESSNVVTFTGVTAPNNGNDTLINLAYIVRQFVMTGGTKPRATLLLAYIAFGKARHANAERTLIRSQNTPHDCCPVSPSIGKDGIYCTARAT